MDKLHRIPPKFVDGLDPSDGYYPYVGKLYFYDGWLWHRPNPINIPSV